jgi:hypothetical protein
MYSFANVLARFGPTDGTLEFGLVARLTRHRPANIELRMLFALLLWTEDDEVSTNMIEDKLERPWRDVSLNI